ncbi:hypothetical protein ATG66_0578 [Vibrio sp. ES.051]|nr:hypothetical protein ATG66_0578 [Vibrio sp. ES.051]
MTSVEIEHYNESKAVSSWLLLYLYGYKNPFAVNIKHIEQNVSQIKVKFVKQCSRYEFDEVPALMVMSLPDV